MGSSGRWEEHEYHSHLRYQSKAKGQVNFKQDRFMCFYITKPKMSNWKWINQYFGFGVFKMKSSIFQEWNSQELQILIYNILETKLCSGPLKYLLHEQLTKNNLPFRLQLYRSQGHKCNRFTNYSNASADSEDLFQICESSGSWAAGLSYQYSVSTMEIGVTWELGPR